MDILVFSRKFESLKNPSKMLGVKSLKEKKMAVVIAEMASTLTAMKLVPIMMTSASAFFSASTPMSTEKLIARQDQKFSTSVTTISYFPIFWKKY